MYLSIIDKVTFEIANKIVIGYSSYSWGYFNFKTLALQISFIYFLGAGGN